MVSFPFGGHPLFAQYIAWAKSVGCEVQSGYVTGPAGGAHSITRIVSPDGKKWVIEATDQKEYLTPTTISRLDRRLGLTSPFFSIDDSGYQSTVPKNN